MNKEFIPYEQALELKELGYNEECMAYYFIYQDVLHFDIMNNETVNNEVDAVKPYCIAPLYQQAFRWFREKYDLKKYGTFPHHTIMFNYLSEGGKKEEAELVCLIKLIEIAKNK